MGHQSHHGDRSLSNARYRMMKKYKHRAEAFRDAALTKEERLAWERVVSWFDDILVGRTYLNGNGAIALRPIPESAQEKGGTA